MLTSMCDESCSHQLPHHQCEVGGNGHHPVLEILVQFTAVL